MHEHHERRRVGGGIEKTMGVARMCTGLDGGAPRLAATPFTAQGP